MKNFLLSVILTICFQTGLGAQETDLSSKREKSQQAYSQTMEQLKTKEAIFKKSQRDSLLSQLELMQKKATAAADIENVISIGQVISQLREENETKPSSKDPAVASLLERHEQQSQKFSRELAQNQLSVIQGYGKFLSGLQAALTKATLLDEAIAVRSERQALAKDPIYLAAKALLTQKKPETRTNEAPGVIATKSLIAKRVKELIHGAATEDPNSASKWVQPAEITKIGKDRTLETLRNLHPEVAGIVQFPIVVSDTSILFDASASHASVKVQITEGSETLITKSNWVRENGQWFYNLKSALASNPTSLAAEEKIEEDRFKGLFDKFRRPGGGGKRPGGGRGR